MATNVIEGAIYLIEAKGSGDATKVCKGCKSKKRLYLNTLDNGLLCKECYHTIVAKPQGFKVKNMSNERLLRIQDIVREILEEMENVFINRYINSGEGISLLTFIPLYSSSTLAYMTTSYVFKVYYQWGMEVFTFHATHLGTKVVGGCDKQLNWTLNITAEDSEDFPVYDRIIKGEIHRYLANENKRMREAKARQR